MACQEHFFVFLNLSKKEILCLYKKTHKKVFLKANKSIRIITLIMCTCGIDVLKFFVYMLEKQWFFSLLLVEYSVVLTER